MKNVKAITTVLVLMTITALADFTIKDLFISGGTSTTEGESKEKSVPNERIYEDCK